MGIFSRLGTLIKSNINDLITKAEDPEKMLSQVLLEMQQQLVEAKKAVAVAIADEKKLQKQYTSETDKSKEWERKAMVAGRAGDDNLARQALGRKLSGDTLESKSLQLEQGPGGAEEEALNELKAKMGLLEAPKGESAKQLSAGAGGSGKDDGHKHDSKDQSGPVGPSLTAEDLK